MSDPHTLEVFTIQMGKWRDLKETDIELVDITVKSGIRVFSPHSSDLYAFKANELDKEEFSSRYIAKLKCSLSDKVPEWDELVSKDRIALTCYCSKDGFCHRYLLVEFLVAHAKELNVNVIYHGEYAKPTEK